MAEKVAKFRFRNYRITDGHIQVEADKPISKQVDVTFEKTIGVHDEEHNMRLLIVTRITDANKAMQIDVVAEGFFEFEKDITAEERNVFFRTSAPAILFPYIRAYVTALSSLSGLPPIILPTLNLSDR